MTEHELPMRAYACTGAGIKKGTIVKITNKREFSGSMFVSIPIVGTNRVKMVERQYCNCFYTVLVKWDDGTESHEDPKYLLLDKDKQRIVDKVTATNSGWTDVRKVQMFGENAGSPVWSGIINGIRTPLF